MIRAATFDDVPALLALGERMHAESPRFSRLAFCRDKLARTLGGVLGNPLGLLQVLDVDGQVRGVVMAVAFEHWCSTDLVATELALFVDEDQRGSISAARLIKAYRRWAAETGAVHIAAGVSTGIRTEQTARLYEAAGFTRFGVLLEA